MKFAVLRVSLFALAIFAVVFVGTKTIRSDVQPVQARLSPTDRRRANSQIAPLSYRSPGTRHKLLSRPRDIQLEQRLQSSTSAIISRYEGYSVIDVSDTDLAQLDAVALQRVDLRDDMNLILLRRGQIDTTGADPIVDSRLRQPSGLAHSLNLVQLSGPPTNSALNSLRATGVRVISYIPNNTYLVWATPPQIATLRSLARQASVVQWQGPYHPAYKLDPRIKLDSVEQIPVSVELADSDNSASAVEQVKSVARRVLIPEFRSGGTLHLKLLVESYRLADLARISEVIVIEPWARLHLEDERANQISAGSLAFDSSGSIQVARPTSPGYLNFLNSVGINSDLDFAIDVSDTGLDQGSGDPAHLHQDFLNSSGASRIAYMNDLTQDSLSPLHRGDVTVLPAHDPSGHGTMNASIAAGFNNRSGSAFTDSAGYQYGLGIAPFARIGMSKVFTDSGDFANISFSQYIVPAYQFGARISSNSWGACDQISCNQYTEDSAAFDGIARDADPTTAGNQGLVLVFAAGNDGAESVSSPGTAKNVIAVGASENFRPVDSDGCGVGPTDADNALDIVDFSGSGPLQDYRSKPDLVAPGTHVQGAASQDKFYAALPFNDLGVCNRFYPVGQTLYTWSSGTSHSTPVVAGASALAFQWLRTRLGTDPSPALVKALLLNSASYMTGQFANDNLPGAHQGWGLLDMGRMFESTGRILYDQSPDRTFTESGGSPFEITGVVDDSAKEFRVMLDWTDAPGDAATNAPYVNQLNLEVTVGGVTYLGNVFNGQYSKSGGQPDFANNVQGVRLPAGTTGPFVIRVRPMVIAGDGVPGNESQLDQDFALVVTNGREAAVPILSIDTANDLAQNVTVLHGDGSSDSSLLPGETAKITVTLSNHSSTAPATIQDANLSFTFGGQTNGQSSTFPVIPPGGTATNATPFQFQIPSGLRCGATALLDLSLGTSDGRVQLKVPIQAGRPASSTPSQLLFDNVDDGAVKWKAKKGFEISSAHAHSGSFAYHVEDPGKTSGDTRSAFLLEKKQVTIPDNAGHVRLVFFHIFNFEPGFDGGVLEISTDSGDTWEDVGSRIITGGYDGRVTELSNNPLGTRFAWTARGRPGVFSQVVVNLDDFAGKQIKLRFTAGFDEAAGVLDGYTGWFIDDIRITAGLYSCR